MEVVPLAARIPPPGGGTVVLKPRGVKENSAAPVRSVAHDALLKAVHPHVCGRMQVVRGYPRRGVCELFDAAPPCGRTGFVQKAL